MPSAECSVPAGTFCFLDNRLFSDDLAYAHALIGAYSDPPTSKAKKELPIHLARVACPAGAQSLNDCVLGEGWGAVSGCTHALDVAVACGPELLAPKMREYAFAPPRFLFRSSRGSIGQQLASYAALKAICLSVFA